MELCIAIHSTDSALVFQWLLAPSSTSKSLEIHILDALSRHDQMERQGIGRHLKEPDGIGEHNNKVNDLSHAGA